MDHLVSLGREEHEDGEEEADERPGRGEFQEDGVVPVRTGEAAEGESREDRGAKGDAEEDGDGFGDCCVGDVEGSAWEGEC